MRPPPSNFSLDIFLVKYDSSGKALWAKSAGGIYHDLGNSVAADTFGNVYITGFFESPTINFDTITLYNADNQGHYNIFITKYDSSGNVLWAKTADGYGYGYSIITDRDNNIFLTGEFHSTNIIFDSYTLTNEGVCDIFIAKYEPNGIVQWALGIGDNEYDRGTSLVTDNNGSIYITGDFRSPYITFGNTTLTNSGNDYLDFFIAKLNSNVGIANLLPTTENSVIIYPNPTIGNFTLLVPSESSRIQILNSQGQLIQKTLVDRQTTFNFSLNNGGLYFIQIITDKKTVTKKLIVTK